MMSCDIIPVVSKRGQKYTLAANFLSPNTIMMQLEGTSSNLEVKAVEMIARRRVHFCH